MCGINGFSFKDEEFKKYSYYLRDINKDLFDFYIKLVKIEQ